MSAPEFLYPEGIRFTCTRCGECCRGFNVMLGPGERARLKALDWRTKDPRLVGVEPARKRGGREVLFRGSDDACVYLGAEKQCSIHEHFGESEKPLMCRLYPFGFVPLSSRVAVDVSFACRGVVEARGAPIAEHVPEWARLVGEAQSSPTQHRFSKSFTIDGDLLWELEHAVLALLTDRAVSMRQRIREVSQFLRLSMLGDPRTEAGKKLRDVMLVGVPKQMRSSPPAPTRMDDTQRAVFFQLGYVLLNPLPDVFHERGAKERAEELGRRDEAAKRFLDVSARPFVDNRELETTFDAVDAVEAGFLEEDDGQIFVERYLAAKIVGQRFLAEGDSFSPFVPAVHRLLLLYPMLLWTGKALASEAGRRAVTAEETRRAVRLLDRSYGSVRLSDLPSKQRKAWEHALIDTELAMVATVEMSTRAL